MRVCVRIVVVFIDVTFVTPLPSSITDRQVAVLQQLKNLGEFRRLLMHILPTIAEVSCLRQCDNELMDVWQGVLMKVCGFVVLFFFALLTAQP